MRWQENTYTSDSVGAHVSLSHLDSIILHGSACMFFILSCMSDIGNNAYSITLYSCRKMNQRPKTVLSPREVYAHIKALNASYRV